MSAAVEPNRLIPLPEFSRITGEGRSTIYQAIQRGEILAVKVGRMTRFSELDAYRRVEARIAAARAASERQSEPAA